MSKREVIVQVGAEGGSITLYGVRADHGWRFQRNVVDQTPYLLDEEEIQHDSDFTSSWDEALTLLGRYPWRRLFPIAVHPEFQQIVWRAVQTPEAGPTSENNLVRWRTCCGITT